MFVRTGLVALGLSLVTTLPAYAVFCNATDNGLVVEFGIHIGEPYTDEERNDFDLMALRRRGVDATAVERWNGCIRAFVRKPEGGQEMQFFDPDTYDRVE